VTVRRSAYTGGFLKDQTWQAVKPASLLRRTVCIDSETAVALEKSRAETPVLASLLREVLRHEIWHGT